MILLFINMISRKQELSSLGFLDDDVPGLLDCAHVRRPDTRSAALLPPEVEWKDHAIHEDVVLRIRHL
jgi:hypothetical protein